MNPIDDVQSNAEFASRMFGDHVLTVDARAAYPFVVAKRRQRQSVLSGTICGAIAVCVLAALSLTPLGGYATQLLTVFEPSSTAPIALTAADREQLRLMPRLTDFGTFHVAKTSSGEVSSPSAAAAALGFTPQSAAHVPPSFVRGTHYSVERAYAVSFTFSATKARAYALRFHRNLPPMPAGLDGTTVSAIVGPAFVTRFGPARKRGVGFIQLRTPRLTSTRAGIAALEAYMLSMPNVPPAVIAQLRAIADPTTTLPIPYPVDKMRASQVDVGGVRGLAIGDQTGLGSFVLWQKNGMTYAVAGPIEESEALALANGVR